MGQNIAHFVKSPGEILYQTRKVEKAIELKNLSETSKSKVFFS